MIKTGKCRKETCLQQKDISMSALDGYVVLWDLDQVICMRDTEKPDEWRIHSN